MAHRYSVADGYRVELERHAARFSYGLFDNLRHLVEVDVAGDNFAKAVCDGDKWLVDVSIGYAAGVQQPAVRRSLKTALYCVASHFIFLLIKSPPINSAEIHHFNDKQRRLKKMVVEAI
jgi:hypothetical protein